jgi:hypothetical protein
MYVRGTARYPSHFTRLSGPNTMLSVDQHHGLRLGVTFNIEEKTALNVLGVGVDRPDPLNGSSCPICCEPRHFACLSSSKSKRRLQEHGREKPPAVIRHLTSIGNLSSPTRQTVGRMNSPSSNRMIENHLNQSSFPLCHLYHHYTYPLL